MSERTHKPIILDFCKKMNYTPFIFLSFQTISGKRLEIYHTNVIISIGKTFAAVGFDSIDNILERKKIYNELENDGKEIITLSENQIEQFTRNMLLLKSFNHPVLVMSTSAYKSLSEDQINKFEKPRKNCS